MIVDEFAERFGTPINFHGFSVILFNFFFHGENDEDSISNNAVDSHEVASNTETNDAEDNGGGNRWTDVSITFVGENGITDHGSEETQEESTEHDEQTTDVTHYWEPDGVPDDQTESIFGRSAEVGTSHGCQHIGTFVEEPDEPLKALEIARATLD